MADQNIPQNDAAATPAAVPAQVSSADAFSAAWDEDGATGAAPAAAADNAVDGGQTPAADKPAADSAAGGQAQAVSPDGQPVATPPSGSTQVPDAPASQQAVDHGAPAGAPAFPAPAQVGSGQPSGQAMDAEALRKQANEQSMQGRLEAERRRNAELEAELKALRLQSAAPQVPAPQAPPVRPTAPVGQAPELHGRAALFGNPLSGEKLDQDTKALIEAFAKDSPELVPLLMEDSKEGARMRRILNEYGADHTATTAELVVERRQVAANERARVAASERAAQEAVIDNHFRNMAAQFPSLAGVFLDRSAGGVRARAELQQEVEAWIKTLPYEQGAYAARAVQGGTTDEVAYVLKHFMATKSAAHQAATPAAQQHGAEIARAAVAGAAVQPRGGAIIPAQPADKNDFDRAWDEA